MLIFVSGAQRRYNESAKALCTEKPLHSRKNALSGAIPRWTLAMAHGGMKIGISSANYPEEPSRWSWNRQPHAASGGTETRPAVPAGHRTLDRAEAHPREQGRTQPTIALGRKPLQTSPLDFPPTSHRCGERETPLPTRDRRSSGRSRPSGLRRRCARTFLHNGVMTHGH